MGYKYTHFLATLTQSGRGMVHVIDATNRPECKQRGRGGYVTPIEGSKDDLMDAEYTRSVHAGMVQIGVGCIKCYHMLDAYVTVGLHTTGV